MDLFWIIYLIGAVQGLTVVSQISVTLLGIALFCVLFYAACEGQWDECKKTIKTMVKSLLWVCLILVFLPTKDTAYKMLAAYGVTEAYAAAQESDKVQAIAGKSLKVLEKAMDDYLDEDGES